MQSTRTNQGGSVLAFIIVGTVLAIGVVGGVYLAHQRGEQQRAEQAAPVAVNNDDKKPDSTTQPQPTSTSGGQTKTEEEKKPTNPTSNSQSGSGTPAQTPTTGQQAAPTTGTRPNAATGPAVSNATALPATGPIDSALQVVALGLLVAVTAAYVQSTRRQSPSSL